MATWDVFAYATSTYKMPSFPALEDLSAATYGQQAVAIDGKVVYEKNNIGVATQPIASTVKMVLGLAVLEKKPIEFGTKGENLTITTADYGDYLWYNLHNGSTTPITIGQTYSEYDALALVMLASSNNMADALVRWVFGSQAEYQTYASEMLNKWEIDSITIGPDASGYNAATVGSAADLVKIAKKVMENPVLSEIVGLAEYNAENVGPIFNTNKLLGVDGIRGVKTGFNGDYNSGYCLVTSFIQKAPESEISHTVTTALLGAPSREASFSDSQAMVEKTQSILSPIRLVNIGDVVGYYDTWWDEKVDIVATENKEIIAWSGMDAKFDLKMDGDEGVLNITTGDENVSVKVKTSRPLKTSPGFSERFLKLFGWKND